jgi:ComF family protein
MSAATALQRFGRAAAAYLLPARCLACDRGTVERSFRGGVCDACWNSVPMPPDDRCVVCDEPLPAAGAARCGRCLIDPPPYRSLRAAAPYRGSARTILLAFKFHGADYLGTRLAEVVVERLAPPRETGDRPPDEVVAVPATARSIRGRGYHPAELLGRAIARRLGARFALRLEKVRETERQSGLPLARRRQNVRGAFRVRGLSPRRVLLVDDVATSGMTARECAARILAAGAEHVDVWCFARASRDDFDRGQPSDGAGAPGTSGETR